MSLVSLLLFLYLSFYRKEEGLGAWPRRMRTQFLTCHWKCWYLLDKTVLPIDTENLGWVLLIHHGSPFLLQPRSHLIPPWTGGLQQCSSPRAWTHVQMYEVKKTQQMYNGSWLSLELQTNWQHSSQISHHSAEGWLHNSCWGRGAWDARTGERKVPAFVDFSSPPSAVARPPTRERQENMEVMSMSSVGTAWYYLTPVHQFFHLYNRDDITSLFIIGLSWK